MKTLQKSLLTGFIFALIFNLKSNAQVDYGVNVNYGISNVLKYDNEVGVQIINNFDWHDSYSLNLFVRERIKTKKISLQQEIEFAEYTTHVSKPEAWREEGEVWQWNQTLCSISIPVLVNYHFSELFSVSAGIVNAFNVKESNCTTSFGNTVLDKYTLKGIAGFEFKIWKHLLIGAKYSYSLTPDYHMTLYDYSWHFHSVTGKVGIIF